MHLNTVCTKLGCIQIDVLCESRPNYKKIEEAFSFHIKMFTDVTSSNVSCCKCD